MPRLALAPAAPRAPRPGRLAAPPPDLCPGALLRGRAGALLDGDNAGGAVVLGHRNPLVAAAVAAAGARDVRRLEDAAHAAVARAAPTMEATALGHDGAAVLAAASEAARRVSGRDEVVELHALAPAALAARLQAGRVAAVLADPYALDAAAERLREARTACDRHGAVLIVDERRAAPRWGAGGAQAAFRVRADAAVYGAAMANGAAFAALAGRRELVAAARLRDPAAFAPTPEGLAAAAAAALVFDHAPVGAVLRVRGSEVQAELEAALAATGADRACRIAGDPSAVRLVFRHPRLGAEALRRRVRAELHARGVLLLRDAVHVSYAWGDAEVSAFVDAATAAFAVLARSLEAEARIARAA